MNFNRKIKILLAIVAVVFIIFNILFFLIADASDFNNTTIISWVFMILGFASFITFAALSKSKEGIPDNVFLRFTLFGHCSIYLIVDFVLAVFFTILGSFVKISPVWSISVQLIALGVHIVIALCCLMTKTVVEDLDKDVKQKTSRMKSLRVDSEMLVECCTDSTAKNDFRKFAEAIRYSDPMTCDELEEIENELKEIIYDMKEHLISGEIEDAQTKRKKAELLLKERNRKCLLFK